MRSRNCDCVGKLAFKIDRLGDDVVRLVVHGGDLAHFVAAKSERGDGLGGQPGVLAVRVAGDLGRHDAKVRPRAQQVRAGQPSAIKGGGQTENVIGQQNRLPMKVQDGATLANVDPARTVN